MTPIDSIVVGDRVRKDMGDLKALADSMARYGLLHPVVIKSDNTLIAGARRIEAARLLAWTEIPATVIDVTDLLSAERDENAERKNFTRTEAIAIGRLIAEQHRPAAVERMREGWRSRQQRGDPHLKRGEDSGFHPQVDDVAASAIGMSRATYQRARAVVVAAEKAPERFGDLPSQMDETGNVGGTYREMVRRQTNGKTNGKASRHPVHYRTHYPKPNQEIQRAVSALDGLVMGLGMLEVSKLDPTQTKEWAKSLAKAATFLRRLSKKVANVKGTQTQAQERTA